MNIMKPTNQMIHYQAGSNSIVGLQVMLDDNGQEFVNWNNQWIHITEVPLAVHTVNGVHHREEIGQTKPERRTPVFQATPFSPDLPAFQPVQRDGSGIHPKALQYK